MRNGLSTKKQPRRKLMKFGETYDRDWWLVDVNVIKLYIKIFTLPVKFIFIYFFCMYNVYTCILYYSFDNLKIIIVIV